MKLYTFSVINDKIQKASTKNYLSSGNKFIHLITWIIQLSQLSYDIIGLTFRKFDIAQEKFLIKLFLCVVENTFIILSKPLLWIICSLDLRESPAKFPIVQIAWFCNSSIEEST